MYLMFLGLFVFARFFLLLVFFVILLFACFLVCGVVELNSCWPSTGVQVNVDIPCRMVLGSNCEVFPIYFGLFFSLCIFSTALSTLGVDVDVKVVGISRLPGDVNMKLYMLLEVYALTRGVLSRVRRKFYYIYY